MSKKIIQNWVDIAEYDLQTAKAMLTSGRYLYVAFTCQQTIEKILKALYVNEKNETPPYTHNLIKLLHGLSILSLTNEEHIRFMETLNSYYIETRYTEKISEISEALTPKKCEEIYHKIRNLYSWLKTKL